MTYLKDEKTGVCVEDDADGDLEIRVPGWPKMYPGDEKAESLLRGLLRWKLERETRTYEISALEAALAVVEERSR